MAILTEREEFWYNACPTCSKKAVMIFLENTYHCEACNETFPVATKR